MQQQLQLGIQRLSALLLGVVTALAAQYFQASVLAQRWPSFQTGLPDDWHGCNPAPYGCWGWWTESLNCFPAFCFTLVILLLLSRNKYIISFSSVLCVIVFVLYNNWKTGIPINPAAVTSGVGWTDSDQLVAVKYHTATILFPLIGWSLAAICYKGCSKKFKLYAPK